MTKRLSSHSRTRSSPCGPAKPGTDVQDTRAPQAKNIVKIHRVSTFTRLAAYSHVGHADRV